MIRLTLRVLALAVCVLGTVIAWRSAGTPVRAQGAIWQSERFAVAIDRAPDGWRVTDPGSEGVTFRKRFVANGYWFDETLVVRIARDNANSIGVLARQLAAEESFHLVDQQRVNIGPVTAPFWLFFRQSDPDEVSWLAVVLRRGLAYMIELRATPFDRSSLAALGDLLRSLRFVADQRERAWQTLRDNRAGDAEPQFRALLRADATDANARYGLGLSLLAANRNDEARSELERAAPALGLGEDVRRPLGFAVERAGDPARAVLLWIRAIRDAPDLEATLRPEIVRAAATVQATDRPRRDRQAAWRGLWDDISFGAAYFLALTDSVERDPQFTLDLEKLRLAQDAMREDYTRLLAEAELSHRTLAAQDCQAMLAGIDLVRGADEIAGAFDANGRIDRAKFERGRLTLTDGMRALGAAGGD